MNWEPMRATTSDQMTHEELVYWKGALTARIADRPRKPDGQALGNRVRALDEREKAILEDITNRLEELV